MILVFILFYIEINYIEILFRYFWDVGNKKLFLIITIPSNIFFLKI